MSCRILRPFCWWFFICFFQMLGLIRTFMVNSLSDFLRNVRLFLSIYKDHTLCYCWNAIELPWGCDVIKPVACACAHTHTHAHKEKRRKRKEKAGFFDKLCVPHYNWISMMEAVEWCREIDILLLTFWLTV